MEVFDCTVWEYFKKSDVQNPSPNAFGPIPRPISISTRFKMFEKILAGAKYIQDQGFKHLDLKPSNVLLKLRPDGTWNEVDIVITDFGVGGANDRQTGHAGTPGFASPEQFIGDGHRKSDNYSFGKLMVIIFSKWQTSWNLLFQPISDADYRNINFNAQQLPAFHTITELLKVKLSKLLKIVFFNFFP